ncbi:hypothetical protein AcW1_000049 [Taiwanofungus camphoratus]|nr:hypothetical protein AcW1_000049 [Antrodia cinnamomea]
MQITSLGTVRLGMPDGTAEGCQGHTAFVAAVIIPTTVKTWERTKEEVEQKGGLDIFLKDGSNVLTVRDVKNAIPNFKLLDPRHHAFARFVLSISEAAIKSQEWPGAKQDDKKVDEDHTDAEKGKDGKGKMEIATGKSILGIKTQMKKLMRCITFGSHGPVPALDWNSHRLWVTVFANRGTWQRQQTTLDDDGEGTGTREWTMDGITEGRFAVGEFPVTIACDGNRRKEVNMIERSAGYNWFAAGVSTCL